MDAADGAVVLVKAVDESAHAVIPELDHTAVKTRQDPWPLAVEAQPLHTVTLGLEFRQHLKKKNHTEFQIKNSNFNNPNTIRFGFRNVTSDLAMRNVDR